MRHLRSSLTCWPKPGLHTSWAGSSTALPAPSSSVPHSSCHLELCPSAPRLRSVRVRAEDPCRAIREQSMGIKSKDEALHGPHVLLDHSFPVTYGAPRECQERVFTVRNNLPVEKAGSQFNHLQSGPWVQHLWLSGNPMPKGPECPHKMKMKGRERIPALHLKTALKCSRSQLSCQVGGSSPWLSMPRHHRSCPRQAYDT